jgi:hypothetical protein
MARDWDAVREAKDTYWSRRVARLGAIEAFRIADELRRQALTADPAWPDPLDRREDISSHIRLAECLRRADPPAAVELLKALAAVLRGRGRWYVFGAQAVIAHGVPRLSADVDVTIELSPDDAEGFVHDMKAAGFDLRIDDPDFVRTTRVMPFVHLPTGMPLDVVLAGSGLEESFLSRAQTVNVAGIVLPVIHPEDLIVAKILAGRPKDLEDAQKLWRMQGQHLDGHHIRRNLQLLEEALGQSDLVPQFDAIVRTTRRRN